MTAINVGLVLPNSGTDHIQQLSLHQTLRFNITIIIFFFFGLGETNSRTGVHPV